nr:hypothetical protein [Gammaproteobacteria bacterium]
MAIGKASSTYCDSSGVSTRRSMQDHHASCDAATLLDQTRGEPRSLKARCSKCEHLHAADIAR